MPYFDYCMSLFIYFSKSAIQRISNSFNNCIYLLFKFKIDENESPEIKNDNIYKFIHFL